MNVNYKVIVTNEQDGKLWGTTYSVSEFYKNLGHTDKELAIQAVKSLLKRMEEELKDGNYE